MRPEQQRQGARDPLERVGHEVPSHVPHGPQVLQGVSWLLWLSGAQAVSLIPDSVLDRILALPALIVLDEAYIEFAGESYRSMIPLTTQVENLVVPNQLFLDLFY